MKAKTMIVTYRQAIPLESADVKGALEVLRGEGRAAHVAGIEAFPGTVEEWLAVEEARTAQVAHRPGKRGKLTADDLTEIARLLADPNGPSQAEIAQRFDVSRSTIAHLAQGRHASQTKVTAKPAKRPAVAKAKARAGKPRAGKRAA